MIWTERLILFTLFLQSLEWYQVRALFSSHGIWRDGEGRELGLFSRHLSTLLVGRMVIIVLALIKPDASLMVFLVLSQVLIVLRFRGAYNGGSDYVTTLALLMIWLYRSFPQSPNVQTACLLYLGLQITFSYFLSGIGKLPNSEWRKGKALSYFLLSGKYQVPVIWQNLAQKKNPLLKLASFSVLVFELSFPLALVHPNLCWVYMGLGVIFHWFNFQIFGLNRFFWAWIACYPALLETSQWVSSRI
jgi:hypothetical protein